MSTETEIHDQVQKFLQEFFLSDKDFFNCKGVDEVWHYTTAEGLIGIIRTGQIWATQVSCLNDSLERRYFGTLLREFVAVQRADNKDPRLGVLLRSAYESLSDDDISRDGYFVACFSDVEDDLGQWRGYGGGECGYAIGLRYDRLLMAAGNSRPDGRVLRLHYDDKPHKELVKQILLSAQDEFLKKSKGLELPQVEELAQEFVVAYGIELEILATVLKHPKFKSEGEHRLVTLLRGDDFKNLEFRQRRHLLARHLPVGLADAKGLLPITRVYVGPGWSKGVSRISVGDLLKKFGYGGIPIELSKVPYRIP